MPNPSPINPNLTPPQVGYIAGIIDGEGCIGIYRSKSPTAIRGHVHLLRVAVVNTDRRLMDWLLGATGVGHVCTRMKRSKYHNDMMMWTVTGQTAAGLLRVVQPYLVVKYRQAANGLRLAELTDIRRGRTRSLSEDEWNDRESLYLENKELNRRGAKVT